MSQVKLPFLGTFPDMNGKRVKEKSSARMRSIAMIYCNVSELSERPQGILMDTRSPNVHKPIPDHPPRSSVYLQFPQYHPHLSDVFEDPSEGMLEDVSSETLTF